MDQVKLWLKNYLYFIELLKQNSMSIPAITVFMPLYNAASFLMDSIESVLNQTFSDFELLIVDDGSTDNSINIVNSYRDGRIKLIQLEHRFIDTLNYGLEAAEGKYIARMDADDVMLSTRLQEQFDFMEQHPEIDACGTWMQTFGDSRWKAECFITHEDIVDFMIMANPMAHPTIMMRTTTLRANQLKYREEYIYAEDFKLWLDFAETGRLANIPKVLLHYRCSEGQISNRKKEIQQENTKRVRMEAVYLFLHRLNNDAMSVPIHKANEQLTNLLNCSIITFEAYCQIMYEIAKGVRKQGLTN
jgi:glycosyltransferase involved in cell wall biosynthesis